MNKILFGFVMIGANVSFISCLLEYNDRFYNNKSYSDYINENHFSTGYDSIVINSKNFNILPNYIFNVVYCKNLDLSKNQIQSFKLNTFTQIKNLESLILSYNKIKSAQNFYSANLTQLRSLNLAFNQIEFLNGTFSADFKNLKFLDFNKNLIDFIRPDSFKNLITIESINLSNNKLLFIPCETFHSLSNLKTLNLGFNKIENICPDSFKGLGNLKNLYLTNNNVKQFNTRLFSELICIETLNIGYNKVRGLDPKLLQNSSQMRKLFASSSQLSSFKLIRPIAKITCLILEKSCISLIRPNDLNHLTDLFKLSLKSSKIENIQDSSFRNLKRLSNLNLDRNKILNISKFTFEGLTSLDTLSVNQNILRLIDSEAFVWLKENLTRLYLNSNLLCRIEKLLFSGMTKLEILDISYNEIESIEVGSFSNLPSLKKLLIQQNNLKALNKFDLPKLTILDLSDNYLESLASGTFKKCSRLKELFLDKNRLDHFSSELLGNLSLNFLGLNKNYILNPSTLPATKLEIKRNKLESVNNDLFAKSTIIDLSHNKVVSITNGSIYGNFLVKKIYLQFNKLKKIDFLLTKFTGLETLDLCGNLIEELKIENFNYVLKLKYLNLSLNPILHIEPDFFKNLAQIKFIDVSNLYLSNQHIQDILNLYHIKEVNFGYLKNTEFNFSQLKKKSLKSIYLNNLNIDYTVDIDFRNFPFLELIDASFTRNRFLDNMDFYNLGMFRSLEMSGCGLTSNNLTNLNKFRLIKHLNLSFNNIGCLNTSMFEGMQSLGVLDLRNNQIKSIEENIFYSFAFFTLNLDNNFIQTLQDLKVTQLRTLKLRNNIIKYIDKIDEPFFKCLELDLAFNQIENVSLHEMIDDYNQLSLLDLSNNRIIRLGKEFVSHIFELKILFLHNNQIIDIDEGSFVSLTMLENLNLANNSIKNLPNEIFKELISLKYLNLSHNKLEILSESIFKNLFNVLNIDLGSNRLKKIENFAFKNFNLLESLNLENNQELYLKENSLYGLQSIQFINMSYRTVKEFKQTILNSLKVYQEKVVNGIIYYKSLNIRFNDHDPVCELILNFIRHNIHLNLMFLYEYEEFIKNCNKMFLY